MLIGDRIVRRHRVWIGAILLLVSIAGGVTMGVATLRSFDFYTLKPTGWVVRDAETGGPALVTRALKELRSRLNLDPRGALNDDQVRRITDLCLTEQARPVLSAGVGDEAVEMLGGLFAADLLSGERRTQFLENLQAVQVRVRPKLISTKRFQASIEISMRAPNAGPGITGRGVGVRCDGKSFADGFGRWQGGGTRSRGASSTRLPPLPAGSHVLEFDIELTAVANVSQPGGISIGAALPPDEQSKPIHRFVKTLTVPVEVLEAAPADYITLRKDPAMEPGLRRSLEVQRLRYEGGDQLRGQLSVRSGLPVGIAFDVFAEYDGKSVRLEGSICVEPNVQTLTGVYGRLPDRPARLTLVFRPNVDAAVTSMDATEIWGGELRFEDLPVAGDEYGPANAPGDQD
jgi:hypothetical protein